MAKKSKSTPKAVAAPVSNGPTSSAVAQSQTSLSKPKAKKAKKAAPTKQVTQGVGKSSPSAAINPATAQGSDYTVSRKSVQQTKNIDMMKQPQQAVQSTSRSSDSNERPTTASEGQDSEVFRLAAAIPIPMSPTVERQFYESQLLLSALQKVRGDHSKRQNYHGELDQDATELRRSFVDKLAYICDFKKGASTVTALALQKNYQGVKFWLAANETVKGKVKNFLLEILQLLKMRMSEVGASRKTTESQLLARIISFNKERLDYYWSALSTGLELCSERLEKLEGSTSRFFLNIMGD